MFDYLYMIKDYSVSGQGADTVGFTGAAMFSAGIPDGFDEVGYELSIGPIPEQYAGGTISIDSSFYGGGGFWMWSHGGEVYTPDWGGPYSFDIEGNEIVYSGYLRYYDPRPGNAGYKPMRQVRIEMWDADWGLFPDDLLDACSSDESGFFQLGAGGPSSPCAEEADVDGSGAINVADVTGLVAFLFQGGASPAPCF